MRIPLLFFLLFVPTTLLSGNELDQAIGLYQRGEFKQAVNVLCSLSRSSPSDSNVRLWLGKSYLKIHLWDKAVGEMETAVQLEPAKAQNQLWLGRACGARATHSIFITAFGWARRAVKAFEMARKLSPDDVDVRFDLLEYYIEAPSALGGGQDKADAEAQAISKLSPKKGYIARAIILQKNKRWEQAQKELMQATVNYPKDASVYKDLADFLLDRHDYEGAFIHAEKALQLDNRSKRVKLIWAASAARLHTDLDQAEQSLRELAMGPLRDEDPSFEEVYYWLGECYLAKGEKAKARESFDTAHVFNPDYDKTNP
jgi:tetratricopeptide (TPR) repeat protein